MPAWIAAATALALALRLIGIGSDSLWGDEAFTWGMTRLPWREVVQSSGSVSCPGYYVLAKLSTGLLGESEFALRLPAALFMTAAVPLIALLARRISGPRAAIVAAFVAALSPGLVHYGQEARGYGLLVFGSAATLLAFARVVDMGGGTPAPRARDVLALGGSLALCLYAHPYSALEAAALGLYALARWIRERRCPRAAILGLALGGALFLPFLPRLKGRADHVAEVPWLPKPSLESGAEVPGRLLQWGRGDLDVALLGALVLVSWLFLPRPWRRLTIVLAILCWIAPAIYSRFGAPVFRERYAMGLAPLAVAAIGALLARAAERRRRAGIAALAVILLALAAATVRYHLTRPHRPDWRRAFAELRRAKEEGATPVIVAQGTIRVAAYYFRDDVVLVGDTPKGTTYDRLEPLPPGRIAVLAGESHRDAILEAAQGRAVLREMPRTSRLDPVVLVIDG